MLGNAALFFTMTLASGDWLYCPLLGKRIQVWFSNANNKDSFLKTTKYVSLTFLPLQGTKVIPGTKPLRLSCGVHGSNPRNMANSRTGISDETVLMQGLFGVSLRETHILKPDSPPSPRKIQHRITQSSEERLGEKIGATEQEMWFESTLCDQNLQIHPLHGKS